MDFQNLGVLLPSAYRPRRLNRCLLSLTHSLKQPAQIVVSLVADDRDSELVAADYDVKTVFRTVEEYALGAIYAWNHCLKYIPDCDYYLLAADDLIFYKGWLEIALDEMQALNGSGLVGLNDGYSDGEIYAGHWLASRDFLIKYVGGCAYPPMYKSWWCDREVTDLAKAADCYRWARRAVVVHDHYGFTGRPPDRVYLEAQPNYLPDETLYNERSLAGFPVTWEPIIRQVPPTQVGGL